jgi:hypothetical protein
VKKNGIFWLLAWTGSARAATPDLGKECAWMHIHMQFHMHAQTELINSMEQNDSFEANSCSGTQEMSCILCN